MRVRYFPVGLRAVTSFFFRYYINQVRARPMVATFAHVLLVLVLVFLAGRFGMWEGAIMLALLALSALTGSFLAIKFSKWMVSEQASSLGERVELVSEQASSLGERVELVSEQASSLGERVELVSEQASSLGEQLKGTARNSISRARSVTSVLPSEELSVLISDVAPKIGLTLERNQLNYLAARVLKVEANIRGRIACPVATQVLRNICCMSTEGESLRVLEIGTLFGGAVVAMHDSNFGRFVETHFTMIDPLDGYYQNGGDPITGVPVNEAVLRANMAAGGVPSENYRLIKGRSEDPHTIKEVSDEQYDVLLIDGDHGFNGLKADFFNYTPLVRAGGIVLIDDHGNESWPEVKKFIDQELADSVGMEIVVALFDTAVLRKVGPNGN